MKGEPVNVRFWSKVAKAADDGCWLWVGCANPQGYGQFHLNGRTRLAHQVSLEIAGRPRPTGAITLHSCDTPACVNPKHLTWGSPAENARDRDEKGRTNPALGERRGAAKLTEHQVREIRASPLSKRKLAAFYRVSDSVIWKIKQGLAWTHVDETDPAAFAYASAA